VQCKARVPLWPLFVFVVMVVVASRPMLAAVHGWSPRWRDCCRYLPPSRAPGGASPWCR